VSEHAAPVLYEWFPPAGRPPPPDLEAAEAAFARATAAYYRGEAAEAAKEFAAAAELVPATTDERYDAGLAAMRATALRNAALARSAAGHRSS
jgi:hypothetical protein